jgi:hypothetical protein
MPDNTLKHVPGMKAAAAVPVVDAHRLSESEFLADYVSKSRPCMIRGAVRHWSALGKWRDKDYLKRSSGHHSVFLYPFEYHISAEKMARGREQVSFAEAVDRLHDPETPVAIVATAAPTELLADLGRVSFLTRAEPAFSYVPARYFFYRNAGTTWHYHPFDETLMCQIVGTKRIGLINTDTAFEEKLRRIFFTEDYYNDPSAFAALAGTDLPFVSATLEEGDSLYIPPLWWHGIITLTEGFGATASVTWRSPLHVDASAIRRLAQGQVHIIGGADPAYYPHLAEVARKTGLTRELEEAWSRHEGQG